MANFKGTLFLSTRMFVEKEFGPDAASRILAELTAADRALLADATPLAWIPVEPVLRFHHAMDRVCGSGDLSVCIRAGRFSAGWSLNTVLKMFLRFKSPNWLIDRTASVWNRYHDTGRWKTHLEGPGKFIGELHEFAVRDVAMCARLKGWLEGAIELTGGKNAAVNEIRCACVSGGHCAFSIGWT